MHILDYLLKMVTTTSAFLDIFVESKPALKLDAHQDRRLLSTNSIMFAISECLKHHVAPNKRLFRVHDIDVRAHIAQDSEFENYIRNQDYIAIYKHIIDQPIIAKQLNKCQTPEIQDSIKEYMKRLVIKSGQKLYASYTCAKPDANRIAAETNTLLTSVMDIYTLARLFHKPFDNKNCFKYKYPNTMRNVVFYGGNHHAKVYSHFLRGIGAIVKTHDQTIGNYCLPIFKFPQPLFRTQTSIDHVPFVIFDLVSNQLPQKRHFTSPFRPEYTYLVEFSEALDFSLKDGSGSYVLRFIYEENATHVDYPNIYQIQTSTDTHAKIEYSNVNNHFTIKFEYQTPTKLRIELCINEFEKCICQTKKQYIAQCPIEPFVEIPGITVASTTNTDTVIVNNAAAVLAIQPYDIRYNPWHLKLARNQISEKFKKPPFRFVTGFSMSTSDNIILFEVCDIKPKRTCDDRYALSRRVATAVDYITWYVDTTPNLLHIIINKKETSPIMKQIIHVLTTFPCHKKLFTHSSQPLQDTTLQQIKIQHNANILESPCYELSFPTLERSDLRKVSLSPKNERFVLQFGDDYEIQGYFQMLPKHWECYCTCTKLPKIQTHQVLLRIGSTNFPVAINTSQLNKSYKVYESTFPSYSPTKTYGVRMQFFILDEYVENIDSLRNC